MPDIFRFFKMAAVRHLGSDGICVIMPDAVPIGQTVAEISLFLDFSGCRRNHLDFLKFQILTVGTISWESNCVIVPNFVEIAQTAWRAQWLEVPLSPARPGASAYQRIISNNSYARDQHGDNAWQEEKGSTVSSINCDRCSVKSACRAGVSRSKLTWLSAGWRNTQRQSGLSRTIGHV